MSTRPVALASRPATTTKHASACPQLKNKQKNKVIIAAVIKKIVTG
jgi:hypothetical protein